MIVAEILVDYKRSSVLSVHPQRMPDRSAGEDSLLKGCSNSKIVNI